MSGKTPTRDNFTPFLRAHKQQQKFKLNPSLNFLLKFFRSLANEETANKEKIQIDQIKK